MLDEPSWELQKERPMALIIAISEKIGTRDPVLISNYMKKLIKLNSWIGSFSLLLSETPRNIKINLRYRFRCYA
jgi:hypothetical protein